jgi:hypothetical protein
MQNSNICQKQKIDLIKNNISNYRASYNKYLFDQKEIKKELEKVINLINQKNFDLQNNFIKKNISTIDIDCKSNDFEKNCYLKCKEKFNPNNRKPDVFISNICPKDSNSNSTNNCICNVPDYENIDLSIDEINNLVKKKLNLLERQLSLVKPQDLIIKEPCCSEEILCKDGNCSSINELCKIKPTVESFTSNNNYTFNTNHILIIMIIILIVFLICQK